MIFITEKRPDLRVYSPSKGVDVRFKDGRYETSDPREIAVLERNRYVTNFSEVERELTTPSSLDNPLSLHVGGIVPPAGQLPEREGMPGEGLLPPLPDSAYPSGAESLGLLPDDEDDDADRPPAD